MYTKLHQSAKFIKSQFGNSEEVVAIHDILMPEVRDVTQKRLNNPINFRSIWIPSDYVNLQNVR